MKNIEQLILEQIKDLSKENQETILHLSLFLNQKEKPQLAAQEKLEKLHSLVSSLPFPSANLPDQALLL